MKRSTSKDPYDASWDEDNEDLYEEKLAEWEERDWESWLNQNLTLPFEVKRVEDEEGYGGRKSGRPFGIGHTMKVLSVFEDDDKYGILIKVREGRETGYVPLCDVEVTSKDDPNFWPVREYVVWFANR